LKSLWDQFLGLARPLAEYDIRRHEVLGCAMAGMVFGALLWPIATAITVVAGAYLLTAMLLIMVIDSRQFLIPDALSLPAIVIGLAYAVASSAGEAVDILLDRLAAVMIAGGIFYGLRHFYMRVRGVEGLGLGDVKLAMAAGAWVGLSALPNTCLLATLSALLAVIFRAVFRRSGEIGMKTAIPFGSFIAPSIVAVWLYETLAP
jgi:leader peptidase (prepilin peptidase)/N-methyltransferase